MAKRKGAVAQLGERMLCKHEVIGSIPFTSTNLLRNKIRILRSRVENAELSVARLTLVF